MRSVPLAVLLAASSAWAGAPMTSPTNNMARDVVDGGGSASSSANGSLIGSMAEEVVRIDPASGSGVIKSGWSEIAYFPGILTSLTPGADITASSVTLTLPTPPYDGTHGVAQTGSAYLIQIASAPSLGIFANLNTITVSVSTSGQAIGKIVGVGATGLDPNTTYYSQVFLRDSDGDVSPLYTTEFTTFTTLAAAPTVGALEFLSVQTASVTVAWIAPYQLTVASQTNEGYILQASSDNFGGIAQATPAPIFSSTTFNVQSTTLTVGDVGAPLDLGNTYYFQVASLNWQGKPNYATFTKLNFQIAQSTGLLHFGGINPDIARSSVSTSSMVVTNVGNWPVTIQLTGSTATVGGSPWSLGTVPGIEQATLMGTWYSGALGPPAVGPPASEFTTFLTTTPFISSNGGGGNYQGNQDGVQIPPGQSRTLWFYFTMPMSSISLGPESFAVGSQPLFP